MIKAEQFKVAFSQFAYDKHHNIMFQISCEETTTRPVIRKRGRDKSWMIWRGEGEGKGQ